MTSARRGRHPDPPRPHTHAHPCQHDHDADEEARDMNLSELKKLQSAFTLLAENQRRHMDAISEKIESLASMQMQSGSKLDFLDGQMKKIVPHFAD